MTDGEIVEILKSIKKSSDMVEKGLMTVQDHIRISQERENKAEEVKDRIKQHVNRAILRARKRRSESPTTILEYYYAKIDFEMDDLFPSKKARKSKEEDEKKEDEKEDEKKDEKKDEKEE
jgi:hypothetical protein